VAAIQQIGVFLVHADPLYFPQTTGAKFTIRTAVLGPIFVQFINSSGRSNTNKQELFLNLFSLKAQWRHIQSTEIYIAPEVSSRPVHSNRAFV